VSGGAGYTTVPTVSFSSGVGTTPSVTAPTATATLGPANGPGQVTAVVVTSGGSGYTSPPTVNLLNGGGTGAMATSALGALTNRVKRIVIDEEGTAYTVDPMVNISGGGGTGAAATAVLGHGANYGKVYMLTALGHTPTGARTMVQMEVTTRISGFHAASALILDGPNPSIDQMPNSSNFVIDGRDGNMCMQTPELDAPAIGGFDNPDDDPPTDS